MKLIHLVLFVLAFTLVACGLPARQIQPASPGLSTRVAATLAALTPPPTATLPPTDTPVPTATPSAGKISGKVCYPADTGVIQFNIYFQASESSARPPVIVSVTQPQETYAVDLPTGRYKVYAWSPDYTVGGLPATGSELDLSSAVLDGVDICNFAQDVPYPPGFSASSGPGSISGRVTGYSGKSDAQFTVVVFNQGTGYWYYVILQPGETDFTFSELDAGRYQVVAYDAQGAAGGTRSDIYVIAAQNTSVGISSWGDGFPENPAR